MVTLRTAGHSPLASRQNLSRVLYPGVRGAGVEFTGLGCSLEEWDLIAASMPESVRPSIRGAWSAAFERAAIAFYQSRPAPGPKRDNSFGQRSLEVRAALRGGALTIREIAALVRRPADSVRVTLRALQTSGDVAVAPSAAHPSRQEYRYRLRPGPSRSGAPHTLAREIRLGQP